MNENIEFGLALLPNKQMTSNVYDAYEKGYQQALRDCYSENPVAYMYEQSAGEFFMQKTLSFGKEENFSGKLTPLYQYPIPINFCTRCGKKVFHPNLIHTCTPPDTTNTSDDTNDFPAK